MSKTAEAPLTLPIPRTRVAAQAATMFLAQPGRTTVDRVAADLGVTRRTLERYFERDVRWPLGRWVRRARMLRAVRGMGAGESVTDVAERVGYRSPSAFVAAFRRELGTTPARYFSKPTHRDP